VGWVVLGHPFGASRPTGAADNTDPTSITSVSEQSLTEQTQVSATLGYSGTYTVINQAQGTITALPAIGQIVEDGQVLYDVNGAPVILLEGATPAYRTLSEGAKPTSTEGSDVEALNWDLVALGYITSADLGGVPTEFTSWTKAGVEDLQTAHGLTANGTLTLGDFVFVPAAARVTGYGANTTLGGQAQPGSPIITATSTSRVVTIDLDADQEGQVAVGDAVSITLPDNSTTPGTVTSVGTVATESSGNAGGSTPTITVLVTPNDPTATGNLDQAPVEVSITEQSVKNVLVVPVDALLALASGGYAIEVVGPKGVHSLEPVTTGLFDDANEMVSVTGPGVVAGQQIVVPGS
jgi:hypothetical protein